MKVEEKLMADENKIRKVIWERKDAVNAKMAELRFETLKKLGAGSGVGAG